jgi:drug/metabolite transporter (DMT)-like permease
MMTVGENQAIFFTGPIWVGVLGYFILKEEWTKKEIFCTGICFLGVLCIVKPIHTGYSSEDPTSSLLGKVLVFIAAWMYALLCIILRCLGSRISVFHSVFTFNCTNVIFGFLAYCFVEHAEITPLRIMELLFLSISNTAG